MAQLHTNGCPGSFVIVPDGADALLDTLLPGQTAGSGAEHSKGAAYIQSLADAFSAARPVRWYQEHFGARKLRLKLVCQRCNCAQGEGYEIRQPGKTMAKLAPALQVGMKAVAWLGCWVDEIALQ